MAFFDDMTEAVNTYPASNIVIEINALPLASTSTNPNTVLNVSEEAAFNVKVTNNGPLTLTGLKVHIFGRNGATLKVAGPKVGSFSFVGDFVSDAFPDIGGHGDSKTIGAFTFKAPSVDSKNKPEDLLKVTLDVWDAKLDHILNAHSDPDDAVNDIYQREVVAV